MCFPSVITRAGPTRISASNTTSPAPPPPEAVTEAIFALTQEINRWLAVDAPDIDLDAIGAGRIGDMSVKVFDPVADYADLTALPRRLAFRPGQH